MKMETKEDEEKRKKRNRRMQKRITSSRGLDSNQLYVDHFATPLTNIKYIF